MKTDVAKVARLIDKLLIVEEKPKAIGRVIALGFDLIVGKESDLRIGGAK